MQMKIAISTELDNKRYLTIKHSCFSYSRYSSDSEVVFNHSQKQSIDLKFDNFFPMKMFLYQHCDNISHMK